MASCPTAMRAKPTGSSGHAPRRSMVRPPASAVPAFTRMGTSSRAPEANAVMPSDPSKYSGRSTLIENVVIMATTTRTQAREKRGFRRGLRSSSGWVRRRWRKTKPAMPARPRAIAIKATGRAVVTTDRPFTSANRPRAESATDIRSSLTCSGSAMFRISSAPHTTSNTTMTAEGRKTLRHPNAVTMRPDTTGAKAGPKVIMQLPMDR